MPSSRLPPTPSVSTELVGKERPFNEGMEFSFQLPPAAVNTTTTATTTTTTTSNPQNHRSSSSRFPASPTSPDLAASVSEGHRAAASAGSKRSSLGDLDLPPPPTRTHRIIQMNPKTQDNSSSRKSAATMAGSKVSKDKDAAAQAVNNNNNNSNKTTSSNGASATNSKKKQGNSTSTAGKKVARKTAHSFIERRRRSKMNEEFGTLKDMIPACNGHEMHKLSILQASIDYVNYLEQCVKDLKAAGTRAATASTGLPFPSALPSPTSPDLLSGSVDNLHWSSVSPELPPGNGTNRGRSDDNTTSPSFSPHSRPPSTSYATTEVAPTVLPSPALAPTHYTPDHSPQQQQRQVSHIPYDNYAETDIDHEASAALLMLNRDRRGTIDSNNECNTVTFPGVRGNNGHFDVQEIQGVQEAKKGTSMSVRDLLNS